MPTPPKLVLRTHAGNESVLKSGLLLYDLAQVIDSTSIRFNGWELRPRSGELVREGKVQRLAQQPLRVLVELLAHPGDVVTREQLVRLLWPGCSGFRQQPQCGGAQAAVGAGR